MSNELIERTVKYLSKNKDLLESADKGSTSTLDLSKSKSIYDHNTALKRPDLSSEHIENILNKTKDSGIRQRALEHPNAPSNRIKGALDHFEKNGMSYFQQGHVTALRNHPNAPKGNYPKIDSMIATNKARKPTPSPKEISLGSGKIETSRFD